MACQTCGHTVQSVGTNLEHFHQFWCPRCGTIKSDDGKGFEQWQPPRWIRMMRDGQWEELRVEFGERPQAFA